MILKLYIFIRNYFHYDGQNDTCSSMTNRKDKEFAYNFLTICRYLNFVKKSENHFISNRKFKLLHYYGKKKKLFSLHFACNGTFNNQYQREITPIKKCKKVKF